MTTQDSNVLLHKWKFKYTKTYCKFKNEHTFKLMTKEYIKRCAYKLMDYRIEQFVKQYKEI